MDLNRCAYTILGILRTKKATDKVHGVTVKEVTALERISRPNTIHKRIKEMQSSGYVAEGVKAGRAKTYFITELGLALLPIKKEDNENA